MEELKRKLKILISCTLFLNLIYCIRSAKNYLNVKQERPSHALQPNPQSYELEQAPQPLGVTGPPPSIAPSLFQKACF